MLVISTFQLKNFDNIILNIKIFHSFKNIFTKHLCLKYARNRLSINIVACNSFHSNRHQKEHFSLWSMSLLRKIGYRFAWNGSGYKKGITNYCCKLLAFYYPTHQVQKLYLLFDQVVLSCTCILLCGLIRDIDVYIYWKWKYHMIRIYQPYVYAELYHTNHITSIELEK